MKSFHTDGELEAGVDEAGRGPLFGRVYAGAVIWDPKFDESLLPYPIKDSKKITKKRRKILKDFIIEHAIAYGVGYSDEKEIDEVNILNATFNAMKRAIGNLQIKPSLLLIDGCFYDDTPYIDLSGRNNDVEDIPHHCFIKGDNTYTSIAAASILAKECHDEYIKDLVYKNPELEKYDLLNNMGYGTKKHMNAIKEYGLTPYHRKSFKLKHLH